MKDACARGEGEESRPKSHAKDECVTFGCHIWRRVASNYGFLMSHSGQRHVKGHVLRLTCDCVPKLVLFGDFFLSPTISASIPMSAKQAVGGEPTMTYLGIRSP